MLASIEPFEDERVQVLLLLAEERQLRLGIVVADRPLSATGADGPLLELDPEGVDLGALDVGVLADGLPIDGGGGREMVVEPAESRGADEQEDGDDDDDREAQVHQGVASVAAVTVGAATDARRSSAEGHLFGDSGDRCAGRGP